MIDKQRLPGSWGGRRASYRQPSGSPGSPTSQVLFEALQWAAKKQARLEPPLVVQVLRLCLPMPEVWVQSLVRELRSHMPCSQKTKI